MTTKAKPARKPFTDVGARRSQPDDLREWIAEHNPDALLADGFDDAIIGVAERCSQPLLVVYDAERCIEILRERNPKWDREQAEDFLSYNTLGAWVGEYTPLFLWKRPR